MDEPTRDVSDDRGTHEGMIPTMEASAKGHFG